MTRRPTVTVVGAGFSGLLTAMHLLSAPDGPCVRLVERAGAFGRGLAYGAQSREHLLNVRAANMSAFPDAPDHFVRWLAAPAGTETPAAFASREAYGDYLQQQLRQAIGDAGPERLLLEQDEVVDLQPWGARWRAETAMGRTLWSEAVVLATGLPSPPAPAVATPELLASPHYVANPWRADLAELDLRAEVLLLGSGLTMVDVALSLHRPGRRLTALSRRGLAPRSHDAAPPPPRDLAIEGSPLQALRAVRRLTQGADWRQVIDRMRGSTPKLWSGWSPAQRRQFLRHLRPWWDVHRHRMAPQVAGRVAEMQRAGELVIEAGSLLRLDLDGFSVRAEWRRRGVNEIRSARFDAVVNCTGQGGALDQGDQPLLAALLRRGLIRPDSCQLGLDVDAASRPLDVSGEPRRGLFAVGPLTRGAFWEMTAVPDLRGQTAETARELIAGLGRPRLIASP